VEGKRIIVIDDDADIGLLIADVADSMGFCCEVTKDAESFLETLNPDTSMIFLDLLIPGLDGIEILRLLAQRKCNTSIVMMSGVDKRVIESARALGVSLGLSIVGHLAKPFHISELETLFGIQRALQPILSPGKRAVIHFGNDELIRAVERDEFVLHYQPQIEISTRRVVGIEGLVRWQHPQRGLIFPDSFIPIAEEQGLIDPLTARVFQHGLSQISSFSDNRGNPLTISLNISATSLRDLDFPDRFTELVRSHNFQPENVILEITEGVLIRELSKSLDILARLRMKGVKLSIDDFGTGYSMMQQLKNVPATELKIDKSIIQSLDHNSDRVIAQKSIELGHELGMTVVAEGVETQGQLDFLVHHGCDIAQGYLFMKPIPADTLREWLHNYR